MIGTVTQAIISHECVSSMRPPSGNVGHDQQFSVPAGHVINHNRRDFAADGPICGKRYGGAGNPRQGCGSYSRR
jgi:hypothetical protein